MKRPSINRTSKMENIMFAGTILAGLALGCSTTAMAAPKAIFLNNAIVQQDSRKVTGTIKDERGEPVTGATIEIKGTKTKTITDIDGRFSVNVPAHATTLVVSYLGYTPQEIALQGRSNVNVELQPESSELNEVVVTALGIKREKKALGYAVSELKGSELTVARENNVMNSLSGKVAGLQVSASGNGGLGSSRIIIRGNNSLAGNNEPLVVIDGVPMDNFNGGQSNDQWNGSDDGNGLSDINPDDIESISVLKGAAAAALYGTRAGNGVLMITTKKGSTTKKGLGVTWNSNLKIENPLLKPEMQNEYGQGTNGTFDANNNMSWGPKMDGQSVTDWTGQTRPFTAGKNDISDFLRTGFSWTNSVEVTQTTDKNSLRVSLAYVDNKGVMPTHNQDKYIFDVRDVVNLTKNLQLDAKVNYVKQKTYNTPYLTGNPMSLMANYLIMPRNVSFSDLEGIYNEQGDVKQWTNTEANYVLNPYFIKENSNKNTRDRFIGFVSLQYKPTQWLTLKVRHGEDMYWSDNSSRMLAKTPFNNNYTGHGNYQVGTRRFRERNTDFLVSMNQNEIFGSKLSGGLSLGGNRMYTKMHSMTENSGALAIPDFFAMSNGANQTMTDYVTEKAVNSLYALLSLSYDNWAYLDVTGRNDWSSTLPKNNRSFFYPSVGFGWIVTDMLRNNGISVPDWLSFLKLRASYAEVGNDTDPYRLMATYSVYNVTANVKGSDVNNTIPLSNLKPENIKSSELGFDLRLFDNRLKFDFTWYQKRATNQILALPISTTTGKSFCLINAGDIRNSGVEFQVSGTPIQNKNFQWDVILNYTKNKNKIHKLNSELTTYELATTDFAKVVAREGGTYGDIIGYRYQRNEKGERVIDADGLPVLEANMDTEHPLGNYMPNWTGSLNNSFRYKDFTFGFQLDYRNGGDIYMGSLSRGNEYGTTKQSLLGRDAWYNGTGGIVAQGVTEDGQVNTKAVNPQEYFARISKCGEEYVYDGTNLRLREVSFGYNVPTSILKKTPFTKVNVSLWGRNLWLIHSNIPGYDPECAYSTGNGEGIELYSFPSLRSFGFNLNVSF